MIGVIATKHLDHVRLEVIPLTFGRARLHTASPMDRTGYLDGW